MDSLGVSVIEIGCINAPDRWQRRQEAPKRILVTLPAFLLFFTQLMQGGGLGSPMFVPGPALELGSLKRQETHGWFLTTRVFWHLGCPQCLETPQGVPLDSLGVCAVEIGRIIAPDLSPTSPVSAEAHSDGGGGAFAFFDRILTWWGP